MSDFNIVDGVILAIVIVSSLLAYSRGLVRELMSIAAWIIAAFLAYFFAPEVLPFIQEIPYIGPILSDSCELAILASFAAVFAIALMLISFFTPLLSVIINKNTNKAQYTSNSYQYMTCKPTQYNTSKLW